METYLEPKKKKRIWIIPVVIVGVIMLVIIGIVVLCFVIGIIETSKPGYSTTATSQSSTKTATLFTPTNTETLTPTITLTSTRTLTSTITQTPTETLIPTETPTPTQTFTPTKTPTPTFTATNTHTSTPTITPSMTFTPTRTFTKTLTKTPTKSPTPTPPPAGLSDWLMYEGIKVGIKDISFNKYLGYFSADQGMTYVSLYIVVFNESTYEKSVFESDFALIDGRGQVTSGVLFGKKSPTFSSCTLRPGGSCEGWWTTMIWDDPETKANLTFRWSPCWISCGPFETPIIQK